MEAEVTEENKPLSSLSSFHKPNSWPERMDSAFGWGLDPLQRITAHTEISRVKRTGYEYPCGTGCLDILPQKEVTGQVSSGTKKALISTEKKIYSGPSD